jgi:hypothetical protein
MNDQHSALAGKFRERNRILQNILSLQLVLQNWIEVSGLRCEFVLEIDKQDRGFLWVQLLSLRRPDDEQSNT